MRRLEQRNKVKKLADTERTKNNSEEKGGEEAKNEEDRDDWGREREVETKRIRLEGWKRRWSARLDTLEMASRKWRNVWKDGTRTGATSCVVDMRKAASTPTSRIHHASSRTWLWIHPTLSHPVIEAREDRCDSSQSHELTRTNL